MTTTDSNGIVRYQTTDPVSPLHTLLNLGMQSVSDAITPLNARSFKTVTSTTRPAHLAGLRIFETDTKKSYISDGTNWVGVGSTPEHAWLVKTTAYNIPPATPVVVTAWDTVDTAGMSFNNSTGTITVSTAGWYDVRIDFHWAGSAGGGRTAQILRTRSGADVSILGDNKDHSGTRPTPMIATATVLLAAGDTLRLSIVHSASTSIGPEVASQPVYFSVTKR